MNIDELKRYRELAARVDLTDDEIVELDELETKTEQDDDAYRAEMAATYAAIQREEADAILDECASIDLIPRQA